MGAGTRVALVLGGGGVSGIAWLVGVMAGLTRRGLRIPPSCRVVGTSAGSVVGAELAHGVSPEVLYERQFGPTDERFREYSQRDADAKNQLLMTRVGGNLQAARRRIGAFALRSVTPDLQTRRAIIQARLTHSHWPDTPLDLCAMDAGTAATVVLNRASDISLVDAVMASCAVPGVWPVVPFGDMQLMDGGLRSMTNADLALESEYVLVLAPLGDSAGNPVSGHLRRELEDLRGAGVVVQAIVPDERSVEAIGDNVLDPARRGRSAQAGLEQGLQIGPSLAPVWRR